MWSNRSKKRKSWYWRNICRRWNRGIFNRNRWKGRIWKKIFKTDKGILIKIKYPDLDDIIIKLENYIKKFMNILEKNVYEGI